MSVEIKQIKPFNLAEVGDIVAGTRQGRVFFECVVKVTETQVATPNRRYMKNTGKRIGEDYAYGKIVSKDTMRAYNEWKDKESELERAKAELERIGNTARQLPDNVVAAMLAAYKEAMAAETANATETEQVGY